jgi:hypothetical protein
MARNAAVTEAHLATNIKTGIDATFLLTAIG